MTTTELTHYQHEEAGLAVLRTRNEIAAATAQLIAGGGVVLPAHAREKGAAAAIVLAGLEIGLQPMEAVRGLHLVEGRVVISADLQLALVKRRGVRVRWTETTATRAALEISQAGHEPLAVAYTLEDAKRAGLAGRKTWQAHPAAMLRARCVTTAIRMYCPELLSGTYSPDESEDFADQPRREVVRADVVDAEVVDETVALRDELLALARQIDDEAVSKVETATAVARKPDWYRRQIAVLTERVAAKLATSEPEPNPDAEPAPEAA